MSKIVIFRSEGKRYIDMIVDVENYDDNFHSAASAAVDKWHESTDGFTEFVVEELKMAGYKLKLIDDCEFFDD